MTSFELVYNTVILSSTFIKNTNILFFCAGYLARQFYCSRSSTGGLLGTKDLRSLAAKQCARWIDRSPDNPSPKAFQESVKDCKLPSEVSLLCSVSFEPRPSTFKSAIGDGDDEEDDNDEHDNLPMFEYLYMCIIIVYNFSYIFPFLFFL